MKLRHLPTITTTLFLLAFSSVSRAEKELPSAEEDFAVGFTMIHPDAKDVESFFQSRRVLVGQVYWDDEFVRGSESGWRLTVAYPRRNDSTDYSYLYSAMVLATADELEKFRDTTGRLIEGPRDGWRLGKAVFSEHPTREGYWELAGYVSEKPAEKDAIWHEWGKWSMIETGEFRYKKLLPDTLAGLEDADPVVRRGAASDLIHMGEDGLKAIPRIAALVSNDNDELVKQAALIAIGRLGGPEAVKAIPILVEAIGPGNVGERAIESLGEIGSDAKEVVPVLIESLSSGDRGIETQSVIALGKIAPKDPRVRKALVPFLDHEIGFVRENTRAILATKNQTR